MNIRTLHTDDLPEVIELFYQTVKTVNAHDYTEEQIAAWTSIDEEKFKKQLARDITYVAEDNEDRIIGFATMTTAGYLDKLFTHKDFQGQGVASLLLKQMEKEARQLGLTEITTESSITALPFFEKKGFELIKEQQKEIRGQTFTNYVMKKKVPFESTDE